MKFKEVLDGYLGGKAIRCKAWPLGEYVQGDRFFYVDGTKNPNVYGFNVETMSRDDWEFAPGYVGWKEAYEAMQVGRVVMWEEQSRPIQLEDGVVRYVWTPELGSDALLLLPKYFDERRWIICV